MQKRCEHVSKTSVSESVSKSVWQIQTLRKVQKSAIYSLGHMFQKRAWQKQYFKACEHDWKTNVSNSVSKGISKSVWRKQTCQQLQKKVQTCCKNKCFKQCETSAWQDTNLSQNV